MRVGIYGYGNLGRGVELALKKNTDMETVGVFTRRDPSAVKTITDIPVYKAEDIFSFRDKIDVVILCGGSATDLPEQTPALAKAFNVVDSFDTHANILRHVKTVEEIAKNNKKTALVSAGWDPGMFSIARLYANAILTDGKDYTFWGKGVSQGHSDAVRRIEGVADARQYTIPITSALEAVRGGKTPDLATNEKHERECFVVAKEGADKAKIEREIKSMPNYFADYKTTVHFITKEEMEKNHSELPHGGFVIRTGFTGREKEHRHTIEYALKLDSNAEFTASVLVAGARAVYRLNQEGIYGCKTMPDIPPAYLSAKTREELLSTLL